MDGERALVLPGMYGMYDRDRGRDRGYDDRSRSYDDRGRSRGNDDRGSKPQRESNTRELYRFASNFDAVVNQC